MAPIPEFILRKMVVPGSFSASGGAFSYQLHNTFAPATLLGASLEVDGQPVPGERLFFRLGEGEERPASAITPQAPFALPVGVIVCVRALAAAPARGKLTIQVDTREAGTLRFSIDVSAPAAAPAARTDRTDPFWDPSLPPRPPALFARRSYRAHVQIDSGDVIGSIHPWIYGQFIEHLENCVYNGVWDAQGAPDPEVLRLIRALQPPLIRYPGGNFASGYHWRDGVGPQSARPARTDEAWHTTESNQVGTDEFLDLCARVGAEPYICINDATGTPAEAAAWVEYCNCGGRFSSGAAATPQLAPPGAPPLQEPTPPYVETPGQNPPIESVPLWGLGNEVWGEWQIGHTDADGYTQRVLPFIHAMRHADPSIRLVAVGMGILSDHLNDPAHQWNETVLRRLGNEIDYLSFHVYHPGEEGLREHYDPQALYHAVVAAPLSVEKMIERIARQIEALSPNRSIGVALDEWNLMLPPPEGAASMHQVDYTLRDALYAAGMLNAFHRQCRDLKIANLAQLVNVLPLIVTNGRKGAPAGARPYATPLYYPFLLYRRMERLALRAGARGPSFDSPSLGNIAAADGVPYLDVTAARSEDGCRLTLGLVNRHPRQQALVEIDLKGFDGLQPQKCWLVSGAHPLAVNSFAEPEKIHLSEPAMGGVHQRRLKLSLPPASLLVATLG